MKIIIKLPLFAILFLSLQNCNYDFTIAPWENGQIPYYLSGEFTENDLESLAEAMKRWEDVCGVRFNKVTPRSGAYKVIHDPQSGWFSTIGENNSICYMHYNAKNADLDAVTHELGHCLGLVHEHQRPDRDLFIDINWGKIITGKRFNFDIIDNPLLFEQGFPYDYSSIMHYPPVSFSVDGTVTVSPKDPDTAIISDGISEIDILKAQSIYGPPLGEDDDFE